MNKTTKNFSRNDIFKKISNTLCQTLCVTPEKVTMKSHLENDLGADSLDKIEMIMEVEEVFDLEIPDSDAEKFETVGDAVEYIDSKKNSLADFSQRVG